MPERRVMAMNPGQRARCNPRAALPRPSPRWGALVIARSNQRFARKLHRVAVPVVPATDRRWFERRLERCSALQPGQIAIDPRLRQQAGPSPPIPSAPSRQREGGPQRRPLQNNMMQGIDKLTPIEGGFCSGPAKLDPRKSLGWTVLAQL